MAKYQKQFIERLDGECLGEVEPGTPGRDTTAHLEFDQPESEQSRRYADEQYNKTHRYQSTIRRPI